MNGKPKNNWSTLPKHIISKIGSHLPFYFKSEIVYLICTGPKLDNVSQIVEKYGIYVREISEDTLGSAYIQKLQQFCPIIVCLSLFLTPTTLDIVIQLLKAFPQVEKILLCYDITPDTEFNSIFNTIAISISQLKYLKYISYSLLEPNKVLSEKLYDLKINFLSIFSQSRNIKEFRNLYTKSHNINNLYYLVDYTESNEEEKKLFNLTTPNFLLNHNTLKALSFCVQSFSDKYQSINQYLSKELLNLFNNSKFYKLTDFEWGKSGFDNFSSFTLFTSPIPKIYHWYNLSRLAIFLVDGHLLTYITQNCPI